MFRSPSWLPRWLRRARPLPAPNTPNTPEAEIALPSFVATTPSAPSTPFARSASPPIPTTPTVEQPTAEQLAAATLRASNAEERVRALEVEIAELKAAARVSAKTLEELAAAHGLFVRAVFCPEKR
ncbi:hypothetical protein MMC32_000454 [Xylographa parallela]|nr:hypothetical protein [Xylographa parallela]